MEEKISVIVPVYNVEAYLCQCIDSIISQTYPYLEIILVDDGSTDNSGRICDEYAQRHDQVLAIHKQNAGLGMARNTGLEHITGKYVTFVDSDDWIQQDLLKTLYNSMISNRVDCCKSGFKRVNDDGTAVSITQYRNDLYEGEKARKKLLPRMIGSSPSQHDSVEMCVCGVLYNADIIRDNQLRFPSERELISEDLVFNIDYMQYANGACTVDFVGYLYRTNNQSLTRSYRPDRYIACAHFYSEMEKKLKRLGYDHMTMTRLKRLFFIMVRMSISQEKQAVSKLSPRQNRANIKEICNDPLLRDVINSYPVKQLQFKQAMFVRFVKWKATWLLQILAEAGVL